MLQKSSGVLKYHTLAKPAVKQNPDSFRGESLISYSWATSLSLHFCPQLIYPSFSCPHFFIFTPMFQIVWNSKYKNVILWYISIN
jgi:hypothetical protein